MTNADSITGGGEHLRTFENLSCLVKYISDYGDFASIDADPIAFIFRFANGSGGVHRCANASEGAI